MSWFSKKPKLPDTLPAGPWSIVHGVQDGQVLVARVHMGYQKFVGRASYPVRVGVATKVVKLAETACPRRRERGVARAREANSAGHRSGARGDAGCRVDLRRRKGVGVLHVKSGVDEAAMLAFAPGVKSHKLQMVMEPDEDWTVYRALANPPGRS